MEKLRAYALFFTVHYGMFMLVHGIFIFVFMLLSISMDMKKSGGTFNPFTAVSFLFPGRMSAVELLESEFTAIIALFISHAVSFYMYFIKTGEYNYTDANHLYDAAI